MANNSLTDCSPLSQACIKALTDRLEDKRKFAASEIEKMTAEFSMSNNLTMINRLIIVLGRKFCLSTTPNTRKGGLLGLAAVMVGFKNGSISEPPPEVVEEVVRPILTCFQDPDKEVRYYACESLYNVTKVAKANILILFDSIFDGMSKIVADPDNRVRGGAELLDKLLKDIIVEQQTFDVHPFVNRLQEYIYAKNPFTRMFIISWVRLLDSKIDLIDHLPLLLDGIFNCLCDSTQEIRASTLGLLSEFLNKIVASPTDKINMSALSNILLKHARNDKGDVVQYTAIAWLRQLIGLMDDHELINFTPSVLTSILPCLAPQSSSEGSISSNARYMPQSTSRVNICEISSLVNSMLQEQVSVVLSDRKNSFRSETISNDLEPIIEVLIKELQYQEHPMIKLAILDWFKKLKKADQELTFASSLQDKLFQILLDTLSAHSDAVVKNALRVIADLFCFDCISEQQVASSDHEENLTAAKDDESFEAKKSPMKAPSNLQKGPGSGSKKVAIASSEPPAIQKSAANITRFIQALCKTFRDHDSVFLERGTFIVLNLCTMVRPELIYKSFAEILKEEKTDLKFAYNMVQKLNHILLTTQPLFGLRSRFGSEDDSEMTTLFHTLYYAWCHSPTAALTLCLLTNNYRHASEIVNVLSHADITLDLLTQIDWVVQLIESPVFAFLRMRLLDANNNQYLIQSLYGLLMILPQSEAYKRLGHRLKQACRFMSAQPHLKANVASISGVHKPATTSGKDVKKPSSYPTLESLMKHYSNVQSQRTKLCYTSENDE